MGFQNLPPPFESCDHAQDLKTFVGDAVGGPVSPRQSKRMDAALLGLVVVVVISHPFENETTQQIAAHSPKKERRCGCSKNKQLFSSKEHT